MKRIALIALIAVAACGGTARAADTCLSLSQARAAYPGIYICTTNSMAAVVVGAHQPRHDEPPGTGGTRKRPPVPVPRSTVLWPTLSLTRPTPVDAAFLTPEPATAWPLLLDVDELTGGPVADCCWPAFDEPPFRERWIALPSNWFASVTQ